MLTPRRGHEALRRGRASTAHAEYFLTICTFDREPGLSAPMLSEPIFEVLNKMESSGFWRMRTAVIMPDHIHLLVQIGDSTDLASAVLLFKGRLTPVLRNSGLRWQQAYFDHRIRTSDTPLAVFLYIYLNPYRAGLIEKSKIWPGYFCSLEDWKWFEALTTESAPQPEWLA